MEKRYYWLKLTEGFFKDKPIKKLRKLAGGDTFTIIYLKMLLLAIGQDNKLYFEGVEETIFEEVALELDEEPEDVRLTMAYLQSKGLIKVMNEDEFLLMQCEEMVGSETDAARRKRRSRDLQRVAAERESKALEQKEQETEPQEERGTEQQQELAQPSEDPAKPKKETTGQIYQRLIEERDYAISDELKKKLETWMKYKMERKEPYKETGLHALLKQVEKHEAEYGTEKMVELVDKCMARGWKGIIFDVLKEAQTGGPKGKDRVSTRVSEVDNW